ncbi:hypothetical protein [Rubrivirga sp. IMCC43871]|uniref:hypothetical protein n=1 Tax=Rubrivirga sp. IMCC43871 TaxID=3391575 RepID=UPI00398FDF88
MIVPNAIDNEALAAPSTQADPGTQGDGSRRTVVLQGLRLQPDKGLGLSDITAELRDAGTDFDLFLGDGEPRGEIGLEITARELEAHATALGLRDDIAALMAQADVLLPLSIHEDLLVVLSELQVAGLTAALSDAISPEIDLGLGLISVVALDALASHWANRIVRAASGPVPTPDARHGVLSNRGDSARSGARRPESMNASA